MFEPYAAKAIVEHGFDTDHVDIWLTFKYPMNVNVKPDESVWVVDIDGTEYEPNSSAWQDAYTLKLVVDDIASAPLKVMVKFDGPDGNLETSWHKNWQPWGFILSQDISPFVETDPVAMAYLDQSVKTTATPTFSSLNITDCYKYDSQDGTEANISIKDADGNTHLLIFRGGILIDYSVS